MASTPEVLTPLSHEDLTKMDAYWRACNYLSAGMIYLRANALLREPLKPEHIKMQPVL
jgi:xylulose-5-phosphate/fructose-6-phosphate phosphoketolase